MKREFILKLVLFAILKKIVDANWDKIRQHESIVWGLGALLLIFVVVVLTKEAFNYFREKSYEKKIDEAKELLDRGKPVEFIHKTNQLLENVKNKNVRTRLKLNLSLGYLYKKDYAAALHVLRSMEEADLRGSYFEFFYAVNLFSVYYETLKDDAAIDVYKTYEEVIEQYQQRKKYRNIAYETQIKYHLITSDLEKAGETVKEALNTCEDKKWIDKFREHETSIKKQRETRELYATQDKKKEKIDIPSNPAIRRLTYFLALLTMFFPVKTILLPFYGENIDFISDKVYLLMMALVFEAILFFVRKEKAKISREVILWTCMFIVPFSVINSVIFLMNYLMMEDDPILAGICLLIYEGYAITLEMKYAKLLKQLKLKQKYVYLFLFLFLSSLIGIGVFLCWKFG